MGSSVVLKGVLPFGAGTAIDRSGNIHLVFSHLVFSHLVFSHLVFSDETSHQLGRGMNPIHHVVIGTP
jgi:hypothetical protein